MPEHRLNLVAVAATALMCASALSARALPAFAAKEHKPCVYCHLVGAQPARGFRGMYYGAHKLSLADYDEEFEAKAAGVKPGVMGPDAKPTVAEYPRYMLPDALNFSMKSIEGSTVNLGRYYGKVVMIVNVASKCGNTPEYAALEMLYKKYRAKGFVVLGFPANNFMQQEPGTDKEIQAFCTSTYNVDFPMFSKISVAGDDQAPLYKFLTSKDTDPKFGGDIEWNFAKFLLNRKGELISRITAKKSPASDDVVAAITAALKEPVPPMMWSKSMPGQGGGEEKEGTEKEGTEKGD